MSYDPNNDNRDRTMPPNTTVPPMPPPVDNYQRSDTFRETRVERESSGLTWLVVVLLVIAVIAALYFLWGPSDAPLTTDAPPTAVEQTAPVATDTAPAVPADTAPVETAPAETAPAETAPAPAN